MPINAGPEYQKLEKEYAEADTISEKIRILQKMLQVGPKHKGAEKLRNDIKKRISKYKDLVEKEKKSKKGSKGISIKKEGAAQVVIIGKTNTGKSFLLSKLTNAKPLIADYEYTTVKPEIGTMDYNGILLQLIEIPAMSENYLEKEKGPMFLGIVRGADLIVILGKNKNDIDLVKNELKTAEIKFHGLTYDSDFKVESVKDQIWKKLDLIYVYTKSPGKNKDYPPVALDKKATVKELASKVHKDFIKKFKNAKIWGPSAKHEGILVGLNHELMTGDVVEFHLKE